MPLGAFRLNSLGRFSAPAAPVARTAKTVTAGGNAKISRAQSKFGGSSALFDGTSDYLSVAASSDFQFGTGSFTLEAWVRQSARSDQMVIFDTRNSGNTSGGFILYVRADNVMELYWNSAYASSANPLPTVNTWYHVAVSRSGSALKVFVNGTSVISVTDSQNHSSTGPLIVGQDFQLTGTPGNSWNGYMDEIRVSNSARYTANFTAPTAAFINDVNTLVLLHCDGDNNTTVFTDDVGVRVPLTPNQIFGGEIDTAQFKFGTASWWQSAEYFGYKYADITELASIGTGDFTIECWVRRQDNPTATKAHICAVNALYGIYYDETNSSFRLNTSSGETDRITGGSISLNTWTHLAVVRSSGVIKLYINGTQTGSNYSDTQNLNTTVEFLIGVSRDGDRSWVGWIDEFRFSKTARYTANFTAPAAAFTNDSNTILLTHFNAADASKIITDDNA
jgi:hypothetical protein